MIKLRRHYPCRRIDRTYIGSVRLAEQGKPHYPPNRASRLQRKLMDKEVREPAKSKGYPVMGYIGDEKIALR